LKKRDLPRSEKRSSAKLSAAKAAPPVSREIARAIARGEGRPVTSDDYVRGAQPLAPRPPRVPPPDPRRAAAAIVPGSAEAVPAFEMRSTETAIEGTRVGFERRLRDLARGLFPVFDTLDLHGLTVEKAETAVRSFCAGARGHVPRTVLIVHGKGLHSPAGHAVLRDEVAHWLSTAPVARDVLCFVTARPKHGGAGATYVLLAARPPAAGNAAGAPRGKGSRL
jgi:DNA-nicking Smr family endonuclease